MNSLLSLLLSLLAVFGAEAAYMTSFDQQFDFICPRGEALSYIGSENSNVFQDRVWEFRCRNAQVSRTCFKSDYVNEFDQLLAYMCPDSYVLTGVESYNDNAFSDRRFKFQCCKPHNARLNNCTLTEALNKYDANFEYTVPAGRVIRGIFSAHSDWFEDRVWKLYTCRI
ncbi:dermatopontin-like [Physella acuta]|uniref:dermatopontin-like n=1 Tax=Physella acuta TaxID=109671 RepID=UPI0027DAC712|nr:dermatopontin-like [Physella acuta]